MRDRVILSALAAMLSYWLMNGIYRHAASATVYRYLNTREYMEWAARLAPRNPNIHRLLARYYLIDPRNPDFDRAFYNADRAVALAPQDYRNLLVKAEVLEVLGDRHGAEALIHKALELAPKYFAPNWQMANLLLRQGKVRDSAPYFRIALQAHPEQTKRYLEIFSQLGGGDVALMRSLLPETRVARNHLLTFLIEQKDYVGAASQWRTLPVEEREDYIGHNILTKLLETRHYSEGFLFWKELTGRAQAEPTLRNGRFEEQITEDAYEFDWRFKDYKGVRLERDAAPSGFSLKFSYSELGNSGFEHLTQSVLVKPNSIYQLRFKARAEHLSSDSLPEIRVVTAGGQSLTSLSVERGSYDWQEYTASFRTDQKTELVVVKVVRTQCPMSPCPILGQLWLSDFSLQEEH